MLTVLGKDLVDLLFLGVTQLEPLFQVLQVMFLKLVAIRAGSGGGSQRCGNKQGKQ